MNPVVCEQVQTNQLIDLAAEIDSLANKVNYTVHQRFSWYEAYIAAFQPHTTILRVSQNGNVLGILPLQIKNIRGTRYWQLRQLVPLSYGPADFFNLLFLPGKEQEISQALALWLSKNTNKWDELYLDLIPETSSGWQPLEVALQSQGFFVQRNQNKGFYKVDTTKSWEEYNRLFLVKNNKDLFKDMRRIEKEKLELHVQRIRRGIRQYFPQILPLYAQRRNTREQTNNYLTKARLEFFSQVIHHYERNDNVELSLLLDSCKNIWAYQLDWLLDGIRYHYMHAYNEPFAKHSPGKILLYRLLQISFSDPDIHECNYMLGESPYKSKLANEKEAYVSLYIQNFSSWRTKATQFASLLTRIRDKLLQRKGVL